MKRRTIGKNLRLGLVGLAALTLAACTGGNTTEKPNVIFFLVDDLGWTDLGCYGSSFYETPNIDKFAGENVRFTSAYADAMSPHLRGPASSQENILPSCMTGLAARRKEYP
jgi:hypothetical protein